MQEVTCPCLVWFNALMCLRWRCFQSVFCKLCSCCVRTYTFFFQGKKFANASQNLLFSVSVNSYFAVIVLVMHYDIFVTGRNLTPNKLLLSNQIPAHNLLLIVLEPAAKNLCLAYFMVRHEMATFLVYFCFSPFLNFLLTTKACKYMKTSTWDLNLAAGCYCWCTSDNLGSLWHWLHRALHEHTSGKSPRIQNEFCSKLCK